MKRTTMPCWIAACLVLAACLSTVPFAIAEDARTIIEKAIKAHGGETKLAKLKIVSSKAKGTVNLGSEVRFTQEITWQWPDRLKNSVTLKSAKPITIAETIVGEDGWSVNGGKLVPLGAVKRDELRTQAHIRRLLLLTPLVEDKTYELSFLDEIRIADRPAVGVLVSCTGERDVKLYFDADTGRLAKIERGVSNDAGTKESVQEEILSDYQEIDGVLTAKKQIWLRDGKKALEMTFTDVRYPDQLDTDVFADPRPYTRRRDVVYGHKSGVALTMDVFTPKKGANGAAILALVSGGWFSDQATIESPTFSYIIDESVKRGYTVFAVCHGSQPRFTVPEAIADVNRAVRYIRYHARDFGIDPQRLGVTGGSAGGHLSLMLGVAGDRGNPRSTDAVERTSSRVQAVACFFPPTDFLNYGEKGKVAFTENGVLANFRTAIDVREFDGRTKRLEHIGDKDKLEALYRRVSPFVHVSSAAPPTLIIHGDADKLVPIQQAEVMVEKLKKAGVPAELVVKKGAVHGWGGMDKDMVTIVDWFDMYLKPEADFPSGVDVGKIDVPGATHVLSKASYRISGSGANIWNKEDAFHFASRKLSGDLVLRMDVEWVGKGKADHRKACAMVRQDLEADAPYADVAVHGDGLIALQYRKTKGGTTFNVLTSIRAPATVQLERDGNVFTASVAVKGQPFQPIGSVTVELADPVHVGLAVCSHTAKESETAIFSNVSLTNRPIAKGQTRVQEASLEILSVDSGERRIVYRAREPFQAPNWSLDGKTFYINQRGRMYTLPVSSGVPKLLETGEAVGCNNDHGLSPDGKWLAISSGHERQGSKIYIVPADGGAIRLVTPQGPSYWHGWSPDGKLLAFCGQRGDNFDIYTIPAEGGKETRLTNAEGLDDGPDYTPDGKFIYFNSERTGLMKIWRMHADGTQQEQVTTDTDYADWFPHPSPDGKMLVFLSFDKSVKGHPANKDVVLRIMPLAGGKPKIVATLFGGQGTINVPSWSPDSKSIAFVSYRLVLP